MWSYVSILDTNMTDTRRCRWMTVLADGVLSEVQGRRRGFQLVIGAGYDVSDFNAELSSGRVVIKSDMVTVMVGNQQLEDDRSLNMSRQIEKLIKQIWICRPTCVVGVSSLLPKPTQETLYQAVIMKNNANISAMCKRLTKYGINTVKYIPVHQIYLETVKHKDEVTGKQRIIRRVAQPHAKFFKIASDLLNETGVDYWFREVVRHMSQFSASAAPSQDPLRGRPSLTVQIDNELSEPESSGKCHSVTSQKGSVADPGYKLKKGKRESSDSSLQVKPKKGKTSTEPEHIGKSKLKVRTLVDKWERLSQGPSSDAIDVELGKESIVRVDLGDQASLMDSVDEEGM